MKTTTSTGLWTTAIAFVLFSAIAGAGWTYRLDLALVQMAQRYATDWLDSLGGFFSTSGGWELTGFALLFVVGAMWLRGRRRLAIKLFAIFLATGLLEYLLKMFLPVPPIPDSLGRTEDFAPLLAVEYPYPYPSGHLLRTTIILGALYLWTGSRAIALVSILYIAGMGYSRFYLGVHWPSDVIGGVLLGMAALAWTFRGGKNEA